MYIQKKNHIETSHNIKHDWNSIYNMITGDEWVSFQLNKVSPQQNWKAPGDTTFFFFRFFYHKFIKYFGSNALTTFTIKVNARNNWSNLRNNV